MAKMSRVALYFLRIYSGYYGGPAYEAVVSELIAREPRGSAGFRLYWGDYLPRLTVEMITAQRMNVNEPSISDVDNKRVPVPFAARLYADFVDSLVEATVDQSVVARQMGGLGVWCIAVTNQYTSISTIDRILRERLGGNYYGAAIADMGNPVQRLFIQGTLPLQAFYSRGHLALNESDDVVDEPFVPDPAIHAEWYGTSGAKSVSLAGWWDPYGGKLRLCREEVTVDEERLSEWVAANPGRDPMEYCDEVHSASIAAVYDMPPGFESAPPSPRGLRSLTTLLGGLRLPMADQVLTGLHHIGGGALAAALRDWPALPDFNNPQIDERKLRDYALNADHKVGGDKAVVFASALGLGRDDWTYLRDELVRGLPYATVERLSPDEYGLKWHVVTPVRGLNGRIVAVKSAWIVKHGASRPSLTSVLVDGSS